MFKGILSSAINLNIERAATIEVNDFNSEHLNRKVTLSIILPPHFSKTKESASLLIMNDGQDLKLLKADISLQSLSENGSVKKLIIVGVHAADRLSEYGIAGKPDFKNRGAKAGDYQQFILNELLPYLRKSYKISEQILDIGYAGCSLGGLTAFDTVFNNPEIFGLSGVFSGSFWWRNIDLGKKYTDAARMMHAVVDKSKPKLKAKFWLEAGTNDEKADRNNNGIIDAIDDTLDLINSLEKKGYKKGYDIEYVQIEGGMHNQQTWAEALPQFLIWAFGK